MGESVSSESESDSDSDSHCPKVLEHVSGTVYFRESGTFYPFFHKDDLGNKLEYNMGKLSGEEIKSSDENLKGLVQRLAIAHNIENPAFIYEGNGSLVIYCLKPKIFKQ